MQNVLKKLKFKQAGIIINPPSHLENEFSLLGVKFSFDKKIKSIATLVFVQDSKSFFNFMQKQLKYIEYDSLFWIAYPKQTSKIKTDINRDTLRNDVEAFGLQTVTAISIDETWSALRFRSIEKVGK